MTILPSQYASKVPLATAHKFIAADPEDLRACTMAPPSVGDAHNALNVFCFTSQLLPSRSFPDSVATNAAVKPLSGSGGFRKGSFLLSLPAT